MAEITTKVCAVAFESFFKKAVLFKNVHSDEVLQKCLEAFASYGLKPSQISVRTGDHTFNYDLSFSLFNGNGTFKISAEKLEIGFQNAVSDKDLEIVEDCVAKIYEHVPLPEIDNTSISATAHATFISLEAMRQYLGRYADPTKQIDLGGTIAYFIVKNWAEEIRVMVDKSVVFPAALFLVWTTTYRGPRVSRDVLKNVKDVFEQAIAKLDLSSRSSLS